MANITNRDIYNNIDSLRRELTHRIEGLESKVDQNTDWRNRITGQATVLFIFIGAAINFVIDYFRSLIRDS